MKPILIATIFQLIPAAEEGAQPTAEVKATVTAELGSTEACKNAIAGLMKMGEVSGFLVNAMCAPYDIGKLEVEKPKPSKPPTRSAPTAAPAPDRTT